MNKDYKVGFRNSFNLNDDWVIDEFVYDEDTKEYTLYVSHAGGELVCPETGEKGERYDCRRPRRWRHMDLAQCKFYGSSLFWLFIIFSGSGCFWTSQGYRFNPPR